MSETTSIPIKLLEELARLQNASDESDPGVRSQCDALRGELERIWPSLSEAEQQRLEELSASLWVHANP